MILRDNGGMNIVIAEQDATDQFEPQVQRILVALGHPEALVTDLSQVYDFLPWTCAEFSADEMAQAQQEETKLLNALALVMGRAVKPDEYLWKLGRELYLSQAEQKTRARPH